MRVYRRIALLGAGMLDLGRAGVHPGGEPKSQLLVEVGRRARSSTADRDGLIHTGLVGVTTGQ
jgi:hypothetical protein